MSTATPGTGLVGNITERDISLSTLDIIIIIIIIILYYARRQHNIKYKYK